MKIEEEIRKFEEYLLKELNYSAKTIESYKRDLEEYKKYLSNHNISFLKINKKEIIEYLKILDNLKLSNRSISRKLSSLRNDVWAAKKTAETESAYQTLYELKKIKEANGALTVDEQTVVADIMDKLNNDDIFSYTEHKAAYQAWAANMAKLEAEAKAAKIAADVDSLYDALYNGKTGADVEALKQSILDDADALDVYTKKVELLFNAAKDEYDVKKAYLTMANKALADADAAEKAAKKAAKDAQDAADSAARDVASGWMPNFDKDYFAKWGRYPSHTDIDYNYNKSIWRQAKYTEGKTGAELADVIDKINDYDVPNAEMKRRAMEKIAQDKAAN